MATTQQTDLVTPERLIARFCDGTETRIKGGARRKGFCGYSGGRGDSLLTGFDDGYEFMGYLEARGWRAIAEKGDWPYVVYLYWPARDGTSAAICEYCEADFTIWTFDTPGGAQAFYKTLRNAP